MRVILEGSLRHFTITELLAFLGDQAHTGTFNAESPEGRARLSFRDGLVVWAEASDAPTPGDVVAKLLGWSDGTFTFLDEVALPEEVTPLALHVAPLLADAQARVAEMQRLLQLYPDDQIVLRVVNRPAGEGEISLSPQEFQILFQFAGGRSLAQVLKETKRPATELFPLVHQLQTNGLLEPAKADPDATARTRPDEAKMPPVEPRTRRPTEARSKPTESRVKRPTEAKSTPPAEAKVEPPQEPKPPEATQVERKPALIGTLTSDDGTMHPLLEETSTIGRVSANEIAIDDASISTRHARVTPTAEGFVIEDLRSRNGTFVNSEKVTEKRLLADGDLVRLGKVILTFNLAVEARTTSSTQELRPER